MTSPAPRVRAVVLAAGAGSRFGGHKLEARVDGKPILQHVLDALAEAGFDDPIVVVAAEAAGTPSAVGSPATLAQPVSPSPAVDWRRAELVTNPEPERGIASSLQLGWRQALAAEPPPAAVLVVLGDQPLLRPSVVRALAAAPPDDARPIVAPRYVDTDSRNPVRIATGGAGLIRATVGDRGIAPVMDRQPELVRWLDVEGDNPDIDTAADLAHVAELAWADRVRRNREQVDRFREAPDGPDFYASVSSIFRDDPDRVGDPVLDALRRHARPDDTWLDIGAGAGRYALPLARSVRRVVAIDPSGSMLGALREGMAEHGIQNIDVLDGRWPAVVDAGNGTLAAALPVDVSLIAHVGYDIEAIGPFLDAMEQAARRECVAVFMERSPASIAAPFWPPIHGEPRIALPALPAFVDLLTARGRAPSVEIVESSRRQWTSRVEVEPFVRRQTWVAAGSAKDQRMLELLDEWLVENDDGTFELSVAEPLGIGIVAWEPSVADR